MKVTDKRMSEYVNGMFEKQESDNAWYEELLTSTPFHDKNGLIKSQLVVGCIEEIFHEPVNIKRDLDTPINLLFDLHDTELVEDNLQDLKMELYNSFDNVNILSLYLPYNITISKIIKLIS